jgi:hypothetical protein
VAYKVGRVASAFRQNHKDQNSLISRTHLQASWTLQTYTSQTCTSQVCTHGGIYLIDVHVTYCEGVGSWRTTSTTASPGEEGDFAVHASVYGKVQAEPNVKPNDKERRKGRKMLLACSSWTVSLPM